MSCPGHSNEDTHKQAYQIGTKHFDKHQSIGGQYINDVMSIKGVFAMQLITFNPWASVNDHTQN